MDIRELKKRKKALGITNERVSELSGVPLSTVQKAFAGTTSAPREDTLRRIEIAIITAEIERKTYEYTLGESIASGVAESDLLNLYDNYYNIADKQEDPRMPPEGTLLSGILPPDKKQGEYTLPDWYAVPPDKHAELIDGFIYDMAEPSVLHQLIIPALYQAIDSYIIENDMQCVPIMAPVGVIIGDDERTVVEPDLFVICRDRTEAEDHAGEYGEYEEDNMELSGGHTAAEAEEDPDNISLSGLNQRFVRAVPDFVIEVLSPYNRFHDTKIKNSLYMRAGVREYWMVDPEKECVMVKVNGVDGTVFYTFRNEVPVSITDGKLKIDFRGIKRRIGRQLKMMPHTEDKE